MRLMNRLVFLVALSATTSSLHMSPASAADGDLCQRLQGLIRDAMTGFEGSRNTRLERCDPDTPNCGEWTGKVSLSNLSECDVMLMEYDGVRERYYSCANSDRVEPDLAAARKLASQVRSCLAGDRGPWFVRDRMFERKYDGGKRKKIENIMEFDNPVTNTVIDVTLVSMDVDSNGVPAWTRLSLDVGNGVYIGGN